MSNNRHFVPDMGIRLKYANSLYIKSPICYSFIYFFLLFITTLFSIIPLPLQQKKENAQQLTYRINSQRL